MEADWFLKKYLRFDHFSLYQTCLEVLPELYTKLYPALLQAGRTNADDAFSDNSCLFLAPLILHLEDEDLKAGGTGLRLLSNSNGPFQTLIKEHRRKELDQMVSLDSELRWVYSKEKLNIHTIDADSMLAETYGFAMERALAIFTGDSSRAEKIASTTSDVEAKRAAFPLMGTRADIHQADIRQTQAMLRSWAETKKQLKCGHGTH